MLVSSRPNVVKRRPVSDLSLGLVHLFYNGSTGTSINT